MIKKLIRIMMLFGFILSACQSPFRDNQTMDSGEPFELYLVGTEEITGQDLEDHDINELPLAQSPIITTEDIVNYNWDIHSFDLTDEAYTRLLAVFSRGLPMGGAPFVVIAYGERIYAGAFWTMLSSQTFNGVVILQPFDPAGGTLFISLGYPNANQFTGEDPRNDPVIQKALEDAGLIGK